MKIHLTLRTFTNWGDELFLCPALSSAQPVPMVCLSPGTWVTDVDSGVFGDNRNYSYLKKSSGRISEKEPAGIHCLPDVEALSYLSVSDYWRGHRLPAYMNTSGFRKSFFRQELHEISTSGSARTVIFRAESLFLSPNQELLLTGNTGVLGHWKTEVAPHFRPVAEGEWQLALNADQLPAGTEYKFVVRNKTTNAVDYWQAGDNRRYFPDKEAIVQVENLDTADFFKPFRACGVVIPVFSIRSADNYGVGDFPSIRKMVDWAELTGQSIIQMLPVNDTTTNYSWTDSYPYNAISIHALHPVYLGLNELLLKNKEKLAQYRSRAIALNALPDIDYEAVMSLKMEYINDLFDESGDEVFALQEYQTFVENNEEWLFPYTCFSILRDNYQNSDFNHWKEFRKYNKTFLENWISADAGITKLKNKIYFTQYLLDKQLKESSEYAHQHGVILKGDIPIGINPRSVDAWTDADLFNMDTQTGAPPDDFAVLGQNWGFPTYNWEEMSKDGYLWWKNRFKKMADFFDAYRIDHILGFFRIWEIPKTAVHALLGYFSPALPYTVEEIQEFGFLFDEESVTTPRMSEESARILFGANAEEVFQHFLSFDGRTFRLKERFNTQRKIEEYFKEKLVADKKQLKEQLFLFCDEVLFVRDKRQPDKFHPRISAHLSERFLALDEKQKSAFSRLYEHFYYHRHNEFWKEIALRKLPPLLESTGMLPCGEDLGMIPACVPDVMRELEILSLEIERMPKTPYVAFEPLSRLPELSVCTTSTHDMSPIRMWWKEDPEQTQRYYNEVLWKDGKAPENCSVDLCKQILNNHLHSPAMLVILPLQDWMSMDDLWRQRPEGEERINVPAIPNYYWRYRMQLSVEELMKLHDTNQRIRSMVECAGRLQN